jgi:glycosyltransferase involved in cell wall biosynthesis
MSCPRREIPVQPRLPPGLAGIYANADIFVHPDSREPFGISLLEAMSSGLALVTPPTGGGRHFADSGNAWLAEPTPDVFAAAIEEIRNCGNAPLHRRRAARDTAERFDWENVMNEYFELYDEIYALVRDRRRSPAIAPAFYSTAVRDGTVEGG